MTPQERELITELFDRLASLERNPRDRDAEAVIRDGLQRAPNAIYALVQTVLVQDEALKAANARIQEYEQGDQPAAPEQPRGFLDSMRDQFFGREEPRGSVPRVPQAGYRDDSRGDPWGRNTQAYAPPQAPAYAQPQSSGPSFLGTAAAAAAGVIGGSLLMGGIRSALGSHQAGPFAGAFDQLGARESSPWSGAAGSDLARDAGINDIGSRRTAFGDVDQARQDAADDAQSDADDAQDEQQDADDFSDSDTDAA